MEHVSKHVERGTVCKGVCRCAIEHLCKGACVHCDGAQRTCVCKKVPPAPSRWCAGSAACAGLTRPVGAVLPGQPVPTPSSLLTFLGYSGSCQQAQPAENFVPCTLVASSPVAAFFPDSPLCLHVTSALGHRQGLCVIKTLESAPHGTVGTGHTPRAGWASGSHCAPWVPCSGTRALGFPSPPNMTPCTTFRRFLQDPAVCPACSASGAKNPKDIFGLM